MKVVMVAGSAVGLWLFRQDLLRDIVGRGHDVTVFCEEIDAEQIRRIESIGVRYRSVPLNRSSLSPVADLALVRTLARGFKEERADLFFGYTAKSVVYGSWAAVAAGVPRRVSLITGLGFPWEGNGWRHLRARALVASLYTSAFAFNDAVVFQNTDDRDSLMRLPLMRAGKTHVVNGSGIELQRFPLKPPAAGTPHFVLIARLLRSKGIGEFVAAARLVKARHPGVRFTLVGPADEGPSGIPAAEVEAWVREGVIRYEGFQSNVQPYIEDCTAYVLPSYYGEGVPRTILEAMAIGRAIITTDNRGCRETLRPPGEQDDNGILVPVRDAAALAAAMLRFVEEPGLAARMGQASRRYVEQRFDVRAVNADMLRIMGL